MGQKVNTNNGILFVGDIFSSLVVCYNYLVQLCSRQVSLIGYHLRFFVNLWCYTIRSYQFMDIILVGLGGKQGAIITSCQRHVMFQCVAQNLDPFVWVMWLGGKSSQRFAILFLRHKEGKVSNDCSMTPSFIFLEK